MNEGGAGTIIPLTCEKRRKDAEGVLRGKPLALEQPEGLRQIAEEL